MKLSYRYVFPALLTISGGLLIWVLSQLDWAYVRQALVGIHLAYLPLYAALNAGCMVLKAVRLKRFSKVAGTPLSLRAGFKIVAESGFLGLATPGRVGELSKVGYLHSRGVPPLLAGLIAVTERITDLVVMAMVAAVGTAFFLARLYASDANDLFVLVAVGCLSAAIAIAAATSGRWCLPWMVRRIDRYLARRRTRDQRTAAPEGYPPLDVERLFRALFRSGMPIACVVFVGSAVQVFVLAVALRMSVGFVDVAFSYAITAMVALVPISISGLGTREATYVVLMGLAGARAEEATILSLLDGFVFPSVLAAVFVAVAFLLGRNPRIK